PDVYPSHRAATLAVADQISESLGNDSKLASSSRILIEAQDTSADDLRLIDEIANNLRKNWPKAEVVQASLAEGRDSDSKIVAIAVLRDAGVTKLQTRISDQPPITARFVEKLWADDWTAFINTDSNHRWLKGESARNALSQSEAEEKAFADAALR